MYSLIVTCKLNDVDPQAWLANVLARIASYPVHRLDDSCPGTGKPSPPPALSRLNRSYNRHRAPRYSPDAYDMTQPREAGADLDQNIGSAVAILDIGRMNEGCDQQAARVGEDMTIAAFDLLARVISAFLTRDFACQSVIKPMPKPVSTTSSVAAPDMPELGA